MSRGSHDSTYGSWSKKKTTLFNFHSSSNANAQREDAAAAAANDDDDDADGSKHKSQNMLKKHRKRPSLLTDLSYGDEPPSAGGIQSAPPVATAPKLQRPAFGTRGLSSKRPPSVFTSLRGSIRSNSDKDDIAREPLSATSTKTPSTAHGDVLPETPTTSRTVLLHGEVQTSAGMFRKKKEYLVLTESTISRYKSQAKAAETFGSISSVLSRSSTIKHGQMPSYGSAADLQTISDSSGERSGRIPLYQVVAVHTLDDGKPYFTIEVSYLDEESGQASSITLQFSHPQERDTWMSCIRSAVREARERDGHQISGFNLENAARIIERDNDYDPANCAIYKIVQRQAKTSSRSSSDDLSKVASTVGFLAIGVHKIHLIPLARPVSRGSSPSLVTIVGQATSSYGILTVSSLRVSDIDDSLEIVLRRPLQRPRTLYLASLSSYEIAARLYSAESYLRPEGGHRFYRLIAPPEVDKMLPLPGPADAEEHSCFQRTLIAYCVAYGVNPTNLRYSVDYDCEDAPRFDLLSAADDRRPAYNPLELLAVMRALRYNETFASLSFANVALDSLNGLHDNYGREYVCTRTKNGTMMKISQDELAASSLLKQEIRALAVTNRKLRRMDFSGCISVNPKPPMPLLVDDNLEASHDPGCGIVEALLPLCQHQITNVDWICLNGIVLSDTDLDYLVGAAVDKACHFRAIELKRCGLTDRSMGLILDALRAQDNTLEAIELAGNTARIEPSTFDGQLSVFGFIRKLDLSFVSRTSGPEPLLQHDTLMIWRLSEFRLSGTLLNSASVDALAAYLAHPRSQSLHELYLDSTGLSGADIATLLQCMTRGHDAEPRSMHLDISANNVCKDLELLTNAISSDMTPTHLSMRAVEYREESSFRKMLAALAVNRSTLCLNISQTALPGDASTDSCKALGKLIATNNTLLELNISGEDSRLASSMFGAGINDALAALSVNQTLKTLHVERQRLGLQGASTLAQALTSNATLQELYCDDNEIPLQGLTALVNVLIDNTSLVYLPTMDDGRATAFKTAEQTMKYMKLETPSARVSSSPSSSHSPVRRGLASVRKTAQRTASAYTPAFPALQSYSRAVSNPMPPVPPPQLPLTLPTRSRQSSETPANMSSSSSSSPSPASSFTVQDIQTTHRLLNEQWDRQCYRLTKYLERNWCLLNNIPVAMEVEDEKFERPESAGSLGKMLEQVKFDTTPRAEKDVYFDSPDDGGGGGGGDDLGMNRSLFSVKPADKPASGFKQFLLDSEPTSPESDDGGTLKQLRPPDLQLADCKTPTQMMFPR